MEHTEQCYKKWFWTKYLLVDDKEEYNMDVVANCFNHFFVNTGSDLAEKNPDQGSSEQNMEKLISRNKFSMSQQWAKGKLLILF